MKSVGRENGEIAGIHLRGIPLLVFEPLPLFYNLPVGRVSRHAGATTRQIIRLEKRMIIYGSRMYFKKNVVKSYGECEHCGRYTKQVSYQGRKFGHLYFIPLIPEGPTSQVLNECSACDMGAHIPMTDAVPLVDSLKERFKNWIIEIQDGQTEVVPEGGDQPVNLGVMIAGTIDNLYCLGEIKEIDSITQILEGSGLEYENKIVQGRWSELKGNLANATKHYQSATTLKPKDSIAWYQWGKAEVLMGNVAGAEHAFGKYLELYPDDMGIYIELATLYESKKDYPKIVKAYDKLYELNPELLKQKPMKKVYKKACKKSGEQGQFLSQL